MNKINYFILLLAIVCIFSCDKQENKKYSDSSSIVSFDINKATKIKKFSDICKGATFIELETKDETIVDKIDKLQIINEKIYIRDKNKLIVFDIHGNYIMDINKRGSAPHEYIEISDFNITDKNEIAISDGLSRKIIFYDNFGNYISHKVFDCYIENFAIVNDSLYAIDCSGSKDKQLLIWNRVKDVIVNTHFEYDHRFILPLQQTFCKYNNDIYYQIPLSNKFYTFNTAGNISNELLLDFKDYNINDSDIKNVNIYGGYIPIDEGGNVEVKTFYENNNFYCTHYICERIDKDADYLHFLSKKTGKEFILNSKEYADDILFYDYAILPLVRTVYNDKFIGVVYPYIWKDCIDEIDDSECDTEQFKTIKNYVSKLSVEQNPILVIYDI